MNTLIARLQRLPKIAKTVQGGVFTWPEEIDGPGGLRFRPRMPLWIDTESQTIHPSSPLTPAEDASAASLQALAQFVSSLLEDKACPQRLEVADAELAEYLQHELNGTGIEVELRNPLPELQEVFDHMLNAIGEAAPPIPSLLAARGVTIEKVRSFAEAAVAYYRAAPWQYLCDEDLIHIESPKPPRGMAHCVVLGAGGQALGLALYPSRAAYDRFFHAGMEGQVDENLVEGLTQFMFDDADENPSVDTKLWREHDLPVAHEHAYPFLMKYGRNGKPARPTVGELAFIEGLLRALASSGEAEIDSGRWRKQVSIDGQTTEYVLAIPDLLQAPSLKEWTQRGFAPDRRSMDRVFSEVHHFLEQQDLRDRSPAEVTEELNRRFANRPMDELVAPPSTPAEQARELCYQAIDTHGRRRLQLARKALEIDPDCAEAHVILAERCASLDDRLQHYRQGMDGAARSLGPKVFADMAGHFWGLASTRPYMRARFGVATTLAELGEVDEAIEHYQELLQLNPNDNQGVRYELLSLLMLEGDDTEAARLLKQFEENSAQWAYSRALLAFRLSGHSEAARRELHRALKLNKHVPELLLADGPIPGPVVYEPGSYEEACMAAGNLLSAFEDTPDALEWLEQELQEHEQRLGRLRREKRRAAAAKKKKKRKGR